VKEQGLRYNNEEVEIWKEWNENGELVKEIDNSNGKLLKKLEDIKFYR